MESMRLNLANLLNLNRKLIRATALNNDQKDILTEELKKIKNMISKAGNLRCSPSLNRWREQG